MIASMAACGDFIRRLTGWRRFGFAVLSGAVSALGFAPLSLFPGLLLGLAALVLIIDGTVQDHRPLRAAAIAGFGFGFGQFLLGLHWIGFAFLVDAADHAWQIPFVAVLFPGFLALFFAAATAVAARFWRDGLSRIFVLTFAVGLTEWLRGHILTGFPWNIPAYGWGASSALLQANALFGAYGLSVLTLLFGFSLATLFTPNPRWRLPALMAGFFCVLFVFGTIRLATTPSATVPGVTLRLVQPNIPQAEKYGRRYIARNWRRLVSLSQSGGNPSIIIWPEAAPPFLLDEQPLALEQIARLTEGKLALITGGLRREVSDSQEWHYANSLFFFGPEGRVIDVTDKFHLVPFGEYLPFEQTLNTLGLSKLTGINGSFTPGSGPKSVALAGTGIVSPLICYEILFPGKVAGPKRPNWFVNVTDDSWFGPWAGPQQHLLVARVRAIEEGVPVIRDANTGISAIIDPLGRITASLGLQQVGVVDGVLPAAIAPTLYTRARELLFWLLMGTNAVFAAFFLRRK